MGRRELSNKFSRSRTIRLHEIKMKHLVHMKPDVLRPSILDEILVWKCHESQGTDEAVFQVTYFLLYLFPYK
jgi:hypothetical protein